MGVQVDTGRGPVDMGTEGLIQQDITDQEYDTAWDLADANSGVDSRVSATEDLGEVTRTEEEFGTGVPTPNNDESGISTPGANEEVKKSVGVETGVLPPENTPAVSDEKYKQRYRTIQGILKHEQEAWKTREAELLKENEALKSSVTSPTTTEKADTAGKLTDLGVVLTEEQRASLDAYDREFDIVSKMEGLKRDKALGELRKEFQEVLSSSLKEITTQLTSQFSPALDLVQTFDEDSHFGYIRSVHPDLENYQEGTDGYNDVVGWIETKPSYLRESMRLAFDKGTAEQVTELLRDYKEENNLTTAVSSAPSSPARAVKRAALTSVPTRRSAVNAGRGKAEDYESAWAEANARQGG